jgi:hypothetical protein
MRRGAAALLLACALGPAAAQTGLNAPAEPKERERRPLNLKLENPSSWATTAPDAEKRTESLPTLGGDARKVEQLPPSGARTSPYPSEPSPF